MLSNLLQQVNRTKMLRLSKNNSLSRRNRLKEVEEVEVIIRSHLNKLLIGVLMQGSSRRVDGLCEPLIKLKSNRLKRKNQLIDLEIIFRARDHHPKRNKPSVLSGQPKNNKSYS